MTRRGLAAGALALLAMPGSLMAAPSRLEFAALRDGKRIGRQEMSFTSDGESLVVRTLAEMAVKLGPISLYRYRHEAAERWSGERFSSLRTRTDANGKPLEVEAHRDGDRVLIMPAAGPAIVAPGDALPFTHWNRRIGAAPLFNPQDGRLVHETVTVSPGRLAFHGDAEIEDFYDEAGTWTGLIGRLKDGSKLEYRRI